MAALYLNPVTEIPPVTRRTYSPMAVQIHHTAAVDHMSEPADGNLLHSDTQ